jgi:YVTN family beta-propeller protein
MFVAVAGSAGAAPSDQGLGAEQGPSGASRIEREGVLVEFSATPVLGDEATRSELMEGDLADFRFRLSSAETREPIQGNYPGVWVDLSQLSTGDVGRTCKERVGTYLQGAVGMRPMIDLNSYFVLVLNGDATISVIDPLVGITGITNLYAMVNLKAPGADWTKSADERRLFVSMPRAAQVAQVDLESFKVERYIDAGNNPVRVALQPDERYLWVGNDMGPDTPGGVTVIDMESGQSAAYIETGRGHHELAFTGDSRYAVASNRDSGTVTVIDIERLERVADLAVGEKPISLGYSELSKRVYIADGKIGEVVAIDPADQQIVARIVLEPGLGPLRISPDGRWGMVVNPSQDAVHVIDTSTNRLARTIAIPARPYQVVFSREFAYVRSLDSERVHMINMLELAKGAKPPVTSFAAGSKPPKEVADLALADAMVPSPQEAATMIVSPGDGTVYYYMEGMNATAGAFRNYGHPPRAVAIANRALRETEPGVYGARVKIPPVSGDYEVAFMLETPRFIHCFGMPVARNPELKRTLAPLAIEYLNEERRIPVGETRPVRFRLSYPDTRVPRDGIEDVQLAYFKAPAGRRTELPAKALGEGVYEAEITLPAPGAYYLYVAAQSLGVRYADLPYLSLIGTAKAPVAAQTP